MQPDGSYRQRKPAQGEADLSTQQVLNGTNSEGEPHDDRSWGYGLSAAHSPCCHGIVLRGAFSVGLVGETTMARPPNKKSTPSIPAMGLPSRPVTQSGARLQWVPAGRLR